jgi:hypothetical protein
MTTSGSRIMRLAVPSEPCGCVIFTWFGPLVFEMDIRIYRNVTAMPDRDHSSEQPTVVSHAGIQLSDEISLSRDDDFVNFVASWNERLVQCSISRKALENYFWAPLGADEKQLLRVYLDGRKRIAVAVERRILKRESEPIVLRPEHFSG